MGETLQRVHPSPRIVQCVNQAAVPFHICIVNHGLSQTCSLSMHNGIGCLTPGLLSLSDPAQSETEVYLPRGRFKISCSVLAHDHSEISQGIHHPDPEFRLLGGVCSPPFPSFPGMVSHMSTAQWPGGMQNA